ncbi:MAG: dicarboxylate/amino acid:cation symporter, partial [Acidobacteria bacterium]|nr:dicarboxylate/amino acid:cation symporter [Acidobacteriota bacterium]
IGLGVVNVFKPGEAISVTAPAAQTVAAPQTGPLVQPQQSGSDFLIHVFPTSVIDSMARGDILQLVVFSSFFGLALAAIGDKGAPLVSVLNTLAETMFKFTDFVMKFAPLGVFAADRRVNRGGAEATRRAQRPLSSLIRGASPKGSRNNRFTFWRERRAGRCKAPRRRRCADIVEERQRRRCPSAAAPRRAAGSQDCRFLFCLMACSASLRAGSKM